MELEDGFDDLLAEICEPTSPKQLNLDSENIQLPQPGTSKDAVTKPASSKTHCVLVNNKQKGAILVSPLTSQLNASIISFVQKKTSLNDEEGLTIFTGVHATFSDGDYTSIEGVPLLRLAITWQAGEPDNYDDSERCLAMSVAYHGKGTMADTRCDRVLPYVCYKKDKELSMTECGTTDPEYVMESRTGSCYKFHNRGRPWTEAYMTCIAEGGYLAVINNDVEARVIREKFYRQPRNNIIAEFSNSVFVGFHDWGHYGRSFNTIHGETLDANYHSWARNQPDNSTMKDYGKNLGEYCGSVTLEAVQLNDSYCNSRLTFLCEKDPRSLV